MCTLPGFADMVPLSFLGLLPMPLAIAAVSVLFLSGVVTINLLFPKP